ncbi:MAG: tRNA pseudouridine(55) synthase TruB [Clostridiales bacterium]|nr:tRNA pseudouridine(55) synthase TruB [Clostridiales bacterium]
MDGVLVIDKPRDFTSFDVVAVMRRLCGRKKVGHTGTLDPMATGVLPLLLGRATRAASLLEDTDKEYEAGFRFGLSTDTQDITGTVLAQSEAPVSRERLLAALPAFRGRILQLPPMYSAVRKNGVRLYELARQGICVEREPRPVTIETLELLRYSEPERSGALRVRCSKGTYIRTLCADLGEALGAFGVMTGLRRTAACGFSLADAVSLEQARSLAEQGKLAERVRPVETLFASRPAVTVTAAQTVRFCNGGALSLERTDLKGADTAEGGIFRVKSPEGLFLGLGKVGDGQLGVLRLFAVPGETGAI